MKGREREMQVMATLNDDGDGKNAASLIRGLRALFLSSSFFFEASWRRGIQNQEQEQESLLEEVFGTITGPHSSPIPRRLSDGLGWFGMGHRSVAGGA